MKLNHIVKYKTLYIRLVVALIAASNIIVSTKLYGQQACDSVNEELSAKFRFLGGWDPDGVPEYLVPGGDQVSQALIDFVKQTLPESVNITENQNYFNPNAQLNTEIIEESEVYLTMVHEGAGWRNTLGFYTYPVGNPPASVSDIDSLVVIFPNVSQSSVVKPGDKVFLGEFPASTTIGYFLIAQGWVGDTICLRSHIIFTDSHLNTFTSEEYRQQTILLSNNQEDKFLLGFEDIIRPGGDNDFNDAVFYITAAPGAIDTTNVPKLPTALLSGDTVLCDENATVNIKVELTGTAPWTIVYNNGTEDIEVDNIVDEVYTFETGVKDTIKLISVRDKYQNGVAEGKAIIKLSKPSAKLITNESFCGENEEINLTVELTGIAPFSLTYMIDGELKTVENIEEEQLLVPGSIGQTLELISVKDQYCNGEITGDAISFQQYSEPKLKVTKNSNICGEASGAILDLSLEGEGPWTLNYSLQGVEKELTIESALHQLEIAEIGEIVFTSVEDQNCVSELSELLMIEQAEKPTAVIEDFSNSCDVTEATIEIALTGKGPWIVHYQLNGENLSANADKATLNLKVAQDGTFKLVSVEDANCENTADGELNIEVGSGPTATIQDFSNTCDDSEATVSIALTGTSPWIVHYQLNGENMTANANEAMLSLKIAQNGTFELVSVEDADCENTAEGELKIEIGTGPTAMIEDFSNSCGDSEATVAVALTGTSPWIVNYQLNGENMSANADEATLNINIAQEGTFKLISVEDADCENTADGELTIEIKDSPTATISGDTELCQDEEATIVIELTGEAPFIFTFTDGESENTITSETNTYEFVTSEFKTYTLISVEDANCTGEVTGSATITDISENIQVEIESDASACLGDAINLNLLGDVDNLLINWTTEGNGSFDNTSGINTTYTPAENETGAIVFYAEVSNGCSALTVSKEVTITGEITVEIEVSPEDNLLTNDQITFTPSRGSYDEYHWDFGDGNSSTAIIASNEYSEGGIYNVELRVVSNGCEGSGSATIEVLSKDELYVPNAFNPKAQNPENQVVKVYSNNVDEFGFYFTIINRWGKTMYETNSFNEANTVGWGGINNNTNEQMELNVFTYILRGKFLDGETFEKTGTVTQVK